ncbi:type II secretion system protein [Pseudoduganella sp. DS3]|uniref:Type II secretion system protein n=1 Tax=Pseudoduganella guangdongensis TaxID=2692179 RepID=A0A6N9HMB1_9BURK|nr:type II secretion system protein [Pseudoduganella guangdongensis]MYN03825.1 type II secretion system protein [Pseudoduganella guangdongensis]
MFTSRYRQSGLTFVELILFILIVGIAVAAILRTLANTNNASADPLRRKQALLIAEALLEEVQLAAFTFCDPVDVTENPAAPANCATPEGVGQEPGNARPFDNINDYVPSLGVAHAAFNNAAGKLVDAAGNELGLSGYSATLTVRAESLNGITSTAAVATQEVLRLTVRVTHGAQAGDFIELDAYRTRYAPQVAQ